MGKRSAFARVERDFYPTPFEAVAPLIPHLDLHIPYYEPCAGDGALCGHLAAWGLQCAGAYDIEPRHPIVRQADARTLSLPDESQIITNPPWDRSILHPLILHLSAQAPTWLLFDADWAHTRQAVPFLPLLRKIVAVGRVKWIPNSPFTGKDNCAWHLFAEGEGPTEFYGRTLPAKRDLRFLSRADLD